MNPFHAPRPFPGAPVLPWPPGSPPPPLPPGAAGVSVWIRGAPHDSPQFRKARAVGIDDTPMWHGMDRAVIVTTPGDHVVEVRDDAGAESTRLVRATAGEIAEWQLWSPATYGRVPGVLVPASSPRRRPGMGMWGLLAALAALGLPPVLIGPDTRPGRIAMTVWMIVAVPLTLLVYSRVKAAVDRRYRRSVSTEAHADPRAADTGMFLADGAVPDVLADAHRGALSLTVTTTTTYTKDGRQVAVRPAVDRNAWLRWPALTIDGTERPLGWQNWCYRLPPGPHELVVTPRPPATPDNAPGVTPQLTVTPARVPVTVRPGEVVHLRLTVHATVAVASNPASETRSTSLTAFTATVEVSPASAGQPLG